MEEARQKLLRITSEETLEKRISDIESSSESILSSSCQSKWWIQVSVFIFFTLFGGVSLNLLISTYFGKGGKSAWLVALMQNAGFPLLLPFLCYSTSTLSKNSQNEKNIKTKEEEPHILIIVLNYTGLGVLLALVCMLIATGLQYLPVSTYSLITATQLGFNAIFSFFLNSQKFTPGILNCIVLLTTSSVICVFQNESGDSGSNFSRKFFVGFISTILASATYPLQLCLTELSFQKVLKSKDFIGIIEMSIFETLVATIVLLIGLFASGDWNNLSREMADYKLGKLSYVIILLMITITTAIYIVASTGLIFKVSSLFSNAVINLSAPITPVFSVMLLHDKMNGLKLVSLFLALWGFASYIYQNYIDDLKASGQLEDSGDI